MLLGKRDMNNETALFGKEDTIELFPNHKKPIDEQTDPYSGIRIKYLIPSFTMTETESLMQK